MSEPTFKPADEVFVREPHRYSKDATCIVGKVIEIQPLGSSFTYRLDAEIVKPKASRTSRNVWIHQVDLGHRVGTPLSQLSGQPGHPGYDRFVAIGESWGYP